MREPVCTPPPVVTAVQRGVRALAHLGVPPRVTDYKPAPEAALPDKHFLSTAMVDITDITLKYVPQLGLLERLIAPLTERQKMYVGGTVNDKLECLEGVITKSLTAIKPDHNMEQDEAVIQTVLSHPLLRQAMLANEIGLSERKDLPNDGIRHSWNVLRDAITLAVAEDRTTREVLVVAIAAAFHTMGLIERETPYELASAAFAKDAMSTYANIPLTSAGFSKGEMDMVAMMILDTVRPIQNGAPTTGKATTPLSQYLMDADHANISRPEFLTDVVFEYNAKVGIGDVKKFEDLGKVQEGIFFLHEKLQMLEQHRWISETARNLFEAGKERNIKSITSTVNLPC